MGTSHHWCVRTRIETGWNLRPGTLCYSACIWTNFSLSHKIQRNYEELKDNCAHSQLGPIMDNKTQRPTVSLPTSKIKIKPKTQLPLLKIWEQNYGVGSKTRVLCVPTAFTPPKGGQACKSSLQPDSWDPPLLSPHQRNSLLPFEGQARAPINVFTPPTPLHPGHNKALPEFLV